MVAVFTRGVFMLKSIIFTALLLCWLFNIFSVCVVLSGVKTGKIFSKKLQLFIACLIITGVIGTKEIIYLGSLSSLLIFICWGLVAGFKKLPVKYKGIADYFVKALIICGAVEVFLFNINTVKLFDDRYTLYEADINKAITENFDKNTHKNTESGAIAIEFINVDMPLGSIYIKAHSDINPSVNVTMSITDDTYSVYYRSDVINGEIIRYNDHSSHLTCNASGDVHSLKIKINAAKGETITVDSIVFNKPIPFNFSFIRYGVMLIVAMGGYMLIRSPLWKKTIAENDKGTAIFTIAVTGLLVYFAFFQVNCYRPFTEENLKEDFSLTTGDQLTKELVDAFKKGQVELDIKPGQELLALANPYDRSQRLASGVSHLWDHLLYEGKYYSYYGIAPVLLLFLPYNLITGYYFPGHIAVFIFGIIGIIFLSLFYNAFMKRFFKNIPSSLYAASLVMLQGVTGVWFCFSSPKFYEIAQLSAFAFVCMGAYLIISSNVIGEGKISNIRLCLSSVCLSLSVLCRPTSALYCIAALILIYAGFKKKRDSGNKKYIPYFISALLPFVVIGGVQMVYNYLRFGSVFDFGIDYSLTINDFTKTEYHTEFAVIGVFNYLFAPPVFTDISPYFDFNRVYTFTPNGYYFIATYSALGIMWKALPVLSYGYSLRAYSLSKNKNRLLYTVIIGFTCIITPLIIMWSIWESGYGARYCADFAWQLLIGAFIIAYIYYTNASKEKQVLIRKLFAISMLIGFVLVFIQSTKWTLFTPGEVEYKAAIKGFYHLWVV